MILVTGARHSGTTYVMQIAQQAGLDLGYDLHSISPRQGLEWQPWRALASRAALAMGAKLEPQPGWAKIKFSRRENVRGRFDEELAGLEWPEVVKFPEMGQSGLLEMIRPEHTIVVVRDPKAWADSMKTQNGPSRTMDEDDLLEGMVQKIGWVIVQLEEARLEYTIVQYPRLARDREYAMAKLEPIFGPDAGEAWAQATNVRWDRR